MKMESYGCVHFTKDCYKEKCNGKLKIKGDQAICDKCGQKRILCKTCQQEVNNETKEREKHSKEGGNQEQRQELPLRDDLHRRSGQGRKDGTANAGDGE
jgi:hypothetical protein